MLLLVIHVAVCNTVVSIVSIVLSENGAPLACEVHQVHFSPELDVRILYPSKIWMLKTSRRLRSSAPAMQA